MACSSGPRCYAGLEVDLRFRGDFPDELLLLEACEKKKEGIDLLGKLLFSCKPFNYFHNPFYCPFSSNGQYRLICYKHRRVVIDTRLEPNFPSLSLAIIFANNAWQLASG